MKKVLIFCCLLYCGWNQLLLAQTGDFYLSQFAPESGEIDNQNFDLVQDQIGVIYIANRNGVLTFDGRHWQLINASYSIFSLAIDSSNQVYTAGRNGLGQIKRNSKNEIEHVVLLDSTQANVSDLFTLLIHNEKVYALNQRHIIIYDLKSSQLETINSDYSGDFLQLFTIRDNVYVNTSVSGLKLVNTDKLENAPISALRDKNVPIVVNRKNTEEYLLGFGSNELGLLRGQKLQMLDLKEDQKYIDQAEIIEGIWVNDSLVAISSLKGGVIFINTNQAEIEQIVNYQTGLPDNEVFALTSDSNNGIWIAHSEGFTRVAPNFPFRSFGGYPGLKGKVLSVNSHQDKLYVGTSLGLYCLEEIKDYNEKISYERSLIDIPSSVQQKSPVQKERKGIFKFLRKNRSQNREADSESKVDEKPQVEQKVIYKSIIEKQLEGIRYEYRKLDNINSKVFQLASYRDVLFSGGLDGLFIVKDSTTKTITADPVRYYYVSWDKRKVFVNTYADELKVYNFNQSRVSEVYAFGDFRDLVQYIFEDHQGKVWFCSDDEIYWVEFERNEIVDTQRFGINNAHFSTNYGLAINDSIIFVNERGISYFDPSNDTIKTLTSYHHLKGRYLTGENGNIYINKGGKWKSTQVNKTIDQLELISLFDNVSYISSSANGDYWVVTEKNELYRLPYGVKSDKISAYSLYLKKIQHNSNTFLPSQDLRFDQDESSLHFEIAQPEYSGVLDIEYQYKLKGLRSSWSNWSKNNDVIDFPYLPDGKYELLVKSRTALGDITEMQPVKFRVIPPYWKRPWFYFLEFAVIALILFISIRIKKLGYKYRLLSRLLALLVLIIVVELIQTIAENKFGTQSSPVLDFMIQVTMAIIILPVESVLRKYIFKEKQVKVMDFMTLKDKKKSE